MVLRTQALTAMKIEHLVEYHWRHIVLVPGQVHTSTWYYYTVKTTFLVAITAPPPINLQTTSSTLLQVPSTRVPGVRVGTRYFLCW